MEVDYGELVEKYECLRKYWKNGRYVIVDHESVVLLNQCILLHYFCLVLPGDLIRPYNLFPRVPGRAWYVQFLHDKLLQNVDSTILLDVGTGAYAIYAMLAARIFKTKVTHVRGTDTDCGAVRNSQKIIEANELTQIIDVKHTSASDNMFAQLSSAPHTITMCNPPFYSSMEEMQQKRSEKYASRALVELKGSSGELYTKGGEFGFVMKMLTDSMHHRHENIWFTCLLSRHSSLLPLINFLKYLHVKDHYVQDFTLGQTTRWILLWNFRDWKFDTTCANYKLRKLQSYPATVLPIRGKLQKSLAEIEILLNQKTTEKLQIILESSEQLHIVAEFDCWSRKYRRRKMAKKSDTHIFNLRHKQSVQLIWLRGSNFELFQSFHGFVSSLYFL
ncbi:hypothetical protein BZL39_M02500 [Zygosaccharomyces parabailii]|nr:hypothetical protein BZL39_M02500 [Zygosaccharomyces parabailii]